MAHRPAHRAAMRANSRPAMTGSGGLRARRIEEKLDQPRHKTAALQTNPPLCLPPMWRIGLLVTWKLLDPLHPGRDAGKACLEAIKAQRQGHCFWAQRGPQQKLQVWIGDDVGGCESGARHPTAAFGVSLQPGKTDVDLLAHFLRLLGGEWRSEKDRGAEGVAGGGT